MFGFGVVKLGLVAACLIAVAVSIVALKRWFNPPEPNIDRLGPYTVVSVESGASLTIGHGRRERRHEAITLEGVAAPAEGQPWFAESREALRVAAGTAVEIEVEGRRRDREQVCVFGATGICLQESQLRDGWCWTTGEPSKAWRTLQNDAQKAKRGVWQGGK